MDEIRHLRELLDACHRALERLNPSAEDGIAEAIRETCRLVEERLAQLTAA